MYEYIVREVSVNLAPKQEFVSELIRCKFCKNRGTCDCPMCWEEDVEYEDDGRTECITLRYDYTTDTGFCHKAERREG